MYSQTSRVLFSVLALCSIPACVEGQSGKWNPPAPGAAPAGSPVALHGQLSVAAVPGLGGDGGATVKSQIVDQNGAAIRLNGVSSMWLNWESAPFAESKDALKFMRDTWGVSVIRAAMGVDVDQGYLSNTYAMKSKVKTIVQNAIDLSVYILID